eukprot:3308528-Amphidinium_carterae.1
MPYLTDHPHAAPLEPFAPEGIQRTMDAVKPHMVYIAGVEHEGVSSSSILSAVTHAGAGYLWISDTSDGNSTEDGA